MPPDAAPVVASIKEPIAGSSQTGEWVLLKGTL